MPITPSITSNSKKYKYQYYFLTQKGQVLSCRRTFSPSYRQKDRKPHTLVCGCPQKNSDFSGTPEKSLLLCANGFPSFWRKKTNKNLFSAHKCNLCYIYCVLKMRSLETVSFQAPHFSAWVRRFHAFL